LQQGLSSVSSFLHVAVVLLISDSTEELIQQELFSHHGTIPNPPH